MHRYLNILFYVLIGWYVLLCSAHYLNQRPLWNDEACVLESIRSYSAYQIFNEPLQSLQVFPRVYLFLIQQTSQAFDFSLLSLRFWPFMAMVAGFFLWLKIIKQEKMSFEERLLFVLTWSGSIAAIYYAAELKQYSMDVLVGAIATFFICNQKRLKQEKRILYYVGLFGLPLLAFVSYITYIFLVIILYNCLRLVAEDRSWRDLGLYALFCMSIYLISHRLDMRFTPDVVYSRSGHGDYFVYFGSIGEFLKTAFEGINNLFSRWYAETPKIFRKIARVFAVLGLIQMFILYFKNYKKEDRGIYTVAQLGVPLLLIQFILGAMHKYPFSEPRTSLFFAPFVFYFTIKGIVALKSINRYLYYVVLGLYLIFIVIISLGLAREVFSGDLGAQSTIWLNKD